MLKILRGVLWQCRRSIAVAKPISIEPVEFAERRSKLVNRIRERFTEHATKPLIIVVPSAQIQYSAPDVPYPFRECTYFRYLTGLQIPSVVLLIVAEPGACGSKHTALLYAQDRSAHDEVWDGPSMSRDEIVAVSKINDVRSYSQITLDLQVLAGSAAAAYDHHAVEASDEALAQVLAGCNGRMQLRQQIDALRWIKSPAEQLLMRETCRIGARAMNSVIAKSRNARHENEILGRIEYEMRRTGMVHVAYPPVIAAGERTTIIHYLNANKPINQSDLVLVDAGCEIEGYVSDITRVFPSSGKFTRHHKTIYSVLQFVQTNILNNLREWGPALTLDGVHQLTMRELARYLYELGFFIGAISDKTILKLTETICPHHVSHYLGMDVHDTSTIMRNIPIKPGVAFTVEPGIYVHPNNELVREEFRGVGMRLEDDMLLVSECNANILTDQAIKDPMEIELLMKLGHEPDEFD